MILNSFHRCRDTTEVKIQYEYSVFSPTLRNQHFNLQLLFFTLLFSYKALQCTKRSTNYALYYGIKSLKCSRARGSYSAPLFVSSNHHIVFINEIVFNDIASESNEKPYKTIDNRDYLFLGNVNKCIKIVTKSKLYFELLYL